MTFFVAIVFSCRGNWALTEHPDFDNQCSDANTAFMRPPASVVEIQTHKNAKPSILLKYIYIYIISKQYTHSKAICGLSAHPKKCRLKVSAFFPHCDRSWAYGFPCLAIHLHDQDSKDTEILKKTDSELRQSQRDFCQLFTKSTAEMESECK